MWNHDLVLLGEKKITGYDKDGNAIFTRDETDILCSERSLTRSEFYQASQAGLKPRFTVLVNPFEYSGEKLCTYKGETLSIARTYGPVMVNGVSLLELQLVERIGNV